jgi:hypothetical protein
LVAALATGLLPIQLRQHPTWLAAFSQTTIDEWQIQDHAPIALCQSRSALFYAQQVKDLEHQLNDAI